MASIAFSSRVGAHHSSVDRVLHGLLTLPKLIRNWQKARQTRDALHRLSDKQLDDIGISRGDIAALTFGSLKQF